MVKTPPPEPDYSESDSWAALPGRLDGADVALVPGTEDQQTSAPADVFFLHAGVNWTAYWNAPIDHWFVSGAVDDVQARQFGSVFNGCCRVFMPRYRQEAMAAVRPSLQERDFERALEVAYGDVRRAFQHYLENYNEGRPFIIAGANSGARHGLRLLIEEVAGRPVADRLVAAYLVSVRVDSAARAKLGDITVCDSADEVGCLNTWNLIGRQRWATEERLDDVACVNPLTWRADDDYASDERNDGGIQLVLWSKATPSFDKHLADAQCLHGRLWVTPPETGREYFQPGGPGDYHSQNFAFYFANLRQNSIDRVRAFLSGTKRRQLVRDESPTGTSKSAGESTSCI